MNLETHFPLNISILFYFSLSLPQLEIEIIHLYSLFFISFQRGCHACLAYVLPTPFFFLLELYPLMYVVFIFWIIVIIVKQLEIPLA